MTGRLLKSGTSWYRANLASVPSPFNVANPANIDYAAGGYGAYNSSALTNPSIQGVVCNMNWENVETSQGTRNWTPLDNVLAAWSGAGKHVVIVARYASQKGGTGGQLGILPAWENTRLGTSNTINDADSGFIVPNHFNATFQSDWLAFISALGSHLASSPYKSCIFYFRGACGLGGEGQYLMDPTGPNFTAYKSQLMTWAGAATDAAFSDAWRSYQEMLLTSYRAAIPAAIPVIYPFVDLTPVGTHWTCSDGNQIDVDVIQWAMPQGGFGIGNQGLPFVSGSNGGYGTYAGMNVIIPWINANYPNALMQFQAEQGLTSGQVAQSIANVESIRGRTIEWYEVADATNLSNQTAFNGFQTWVTSTFG